MDKIIPTRYKIEFVLDTLAPKSYIENVIDAFGGCMIKVSVENLKEEMKGTWVCKFCHSANPLTEQSKGECLNCHRHRCRKCGKQGLGIIINGDGKPVLIELNDFGRTAHSLTCPMNNYGDINGNKNN